MTIRVTVEPSSFDRRARLKAVDGQGRAEVIIDNIPPGDACRERNQLLDRLVSSGQYDEVIGDAVELLPVKDAPLEPWVRRPGDPDRPCNG